MSEAVSLKILLQELNAQLRPELFRDYAPNGLQVEGAANVRKIITGVTASEALIDRAIAENADALLVHHGYFWRGENPCITGSKKRRIQKLLDHNISLIGYHLPLDAHYQMGNNVQLGHLLGINNIHILKNSVQKALEPNNTQLLFTGEVEFDSLEAVQKHIAKVLCREPMILEGDTSRSLKKVAWCTGGAQNEFENAIAAGVDLFITGEVSEKNFHEARESGVHFIAAGHHATERYGVRALGQWIETYFGLETLYIDIDNPV